MSVRMIIRSAWRRGVACAAFVLLYGVGVTSAETVPRVSCEVELDHAVLLASASNQGAVVKVSLNAAARTPSAERAPVNVAFVLDRSGSMTGAKMDHAKAAAIEALRRLGPKDLFSVVAYNHQVETLVSAQSASDVDGISRSINSVSAGGGTALFGGVSQAAAEIRKTLAGNYVHRIVLLSDGMANVGPDASEDLGRLGASLIKEGISVSTVGVGEDFNEDLMTQLARRSDGNTYFAASSDALAGIFSAELGDALNIVAKKVKLRVDFPAHVQPKGIVGLDGRIRRDYVELTYNQLYGGQQKFALIQVDIAGLPKGEVLQIADASVTYQDALSGDTFTARSRADVTVSDVQSQVDASRNLSVVNDYNIGNNALTFDQAINLADDGDVKQAVWLLNKSAEQLQKVATENQDERLQEKALTVKRQADEIDQEGHMSKSNRKQLRAEGYQDLQQQRSR